MGYLENSKVIKVGAIFGSGKITPKWFIWENRKYIIQSINYVWEDRQGKEKLTNFSVSDGTNSYEITYNSHRMSWSLNKIE